MRIVYSSNSFVISSHANFFCWKEKQKREQHKSSNVLWLKAIQFPLKVQRPVSGRQCTFERLAQLSAFFPFSVKSFARPKTGPSNIRCVLCCVVYGCGGLFVQLLMFPRFTRARAPSGQKTFTKTRQKCGSSSMILNV